MLKIFIIFVLLWHYAGGVWELYKFPQNYRRFTKKQIKIVYLLEALLTTAGIICTVLV